MSDEQQLYLSLLSEDADAEEVAELTRRLRRELLEVDIDEAEFARGADLPEGAKSPESIDWNSLMLVLGSGAVTGLVSVVNSWVQRNRSTKIQAVMANGAQITFEGDLRQGGEKFQQVVDIFELNAAAQQKQPPQLDPSLIPLRQKMNDHLRLNEVKNVYFDLSLDYEQFGGENLNKDGKIQLLLKHCQRTGRMAEVRKLCAQQNSHIDWL